MRNKGAALVIQQIKDEPSGWLQLFSGQTTETGFRSLTTAERDTVKSFNSQVKECER